jgi:hypothetical protein
MNPEDLDPILRAARIPERPDAYWQRFPDRVIGRLGHADRRPPLPFGRLFALIAGAAVCGLVLGFVLWHRDGRAVDEASLRDGRALRELVARYANHLQAVELDGNGFHTQLSAFADVAPSDPIWLEIREGADRRVIVTFSGQRIRCGGRDVVVLCDVGGQVLLVGDGFFWSQHASAGAAGKFQIRAEQILRNPKKGVTL